MKTDWMPPREEWDFRSVTPNKCRLACVWEYARSVEAITSDPRGWVLGKGKRKGKGANTILGNYLFCEGGLLEPWVVIHDLNRNLFSISDLIDFTSFASKLQRATDPISIFLWRNLSQLTRQKLRSCVSKSEMDQMAPALFIADLNRTIGGECIYTAARFLGTKLQPTTLHLLGLKIKERTDVIRLNKMLLEDAFPMEISRGRAWQPQFWKRFDIWSGSAIRIRPMAEVKEKIKTDVASGSDLAKALDRHLNDIEYALFADFAYRSVKQILPELESWVRKETKKFPDRPRGRAVQPPYDCLRWLSAYRLEKARRQVGVRYADLQAFLFAENQNHPDDAPALPVFDSQAAWSKAAGKASHLLRLLKTNPARFEQQILF